MRKYKVIAIYTDDVNIDVLIVHCVNNKLYQKKEINPLWTGTGEFIGQRRHLSGHWECVYVY